MAECSVCMVNDLSLKSAYPKNGDHVQLGFERLHFETIKAVFILIPDSTHTIPEFQIGFHWGRRDDFGHQNDEFMLTALRVESLRDLMCELANFFKMDQIFRKSRAEKLQINGGLCVIRRCCKGDGHYEIDELIRTLFKHIGS